MSKSIGQLALEKVRSGNSPTQASAQQGHTQTQTAQKSVGQLALEKVRQQGENVTTSTNKAQSWADNAVALLNSLKEYYDGDYKTGDEASKWGHDYSTQATDLIYEGTAFKDKYDTESQAKIDELIAALESAKTGAANLGEIFGQYENAEDYDFQRDVKGAQKDIGAYEQKYQEENEVAKSARKDKSGLFWGNLLDSLALPYQKGVGSHSKADWGAFEEARDDYGTAKEQRDYTKKVLDAAKGGLKAEASQSAMDAKWQQITATGKGAADWYKTAEDSYYTATDEIQALTGKRNAVQAGAAQYSDDGTYIGENDVSEALAEINRQIAQAQQEQYAAAAELSAAGAHMGMSDYEALIAGQTAEDTHGKEKIEAYNKGIYGLTTENMEAEAKAAPNFAELAIPSEGMKSTGLFSDQVDIDYDFINQTYADATKAFSDEGYENYMFAPEKPKDSQLLSTEFYREPQERKNMLSKMTDEEKQIFNALYASDKEKASEYLDRLSYRLNARTAEETAKDMSEFATEKPFWASAASIPLSLSSGAGLVDIAMQNAVRGVSGDYKPIDYNSNAMLYSQGTTAIRGTVAQNLADEYGSIEIDEEEHPGWARLLNGKNLGDVYNLGMSMADSLAVGTLGKIAGAGTALSKIVSSGGAVLLGGAAGTQGVLDALSRGATDGQALAMGIANATFEALFEYWSIDKLVNSPKNVVAAFFQQAGIEGSEEFFTTVANTVADVAIMRENSDFKQTVQKYVELGMSAEDAEKAAMKDLCVQLWWDFAGGAVMGGISSANLSAVNSAVQGISDRRTYKGKDAQSVENILPAVKAQAADDYYPADMKTESGDKTHFLAGQAKRMTELTGAVYNVESKLKAGERITQGDMRKIQGALSEHQRASVKRMAEIALEEAEVGGDTSKTATQITELIMDGKTSSELEFLAQSNEKYASAVEKVITQVVDIADKAQTTETATQDETTDETASIEDFATENYADHADEVVGIYNQESGQDVSEFSTAFSAAYDMGNSGLSESYAKESNRTQYLSEAQRKAAWSMGRSASTAEAAKNDGVIASGRQSGENISKKGSVKGEGVSISDLTKTFNDPQRKAYKALSFLAESLGVDIVLTNDTSTTTDSDGKEIFAGEQGKFSRKEGKIYIAVNAGLYYTKDVGELSKYTMLRSFCHEFTHFIEAWNHDQYNELRRVVFDALTQQGKNVDDMIEKVQAQSDNMSYDAASREVVAEAMTDILPDSKFIETLASKHKPLYEKLLEKLKEFYQRLKDAWSGMQRNPSAAANALKTEIDGTLKYMDSIIQAFDKAAVGAVENYQATTGTEQIGIMDEEQAGEVAVAENATTTSEENTANNDTFEDRLKAEGYTEAEISAAVKQHDEHPMRNQEETQEERESSIEAILNFKRSYDPAKEPREITSSTYQRAQKRLDKEVANFVGARQTPVTPQKPAGATRAQKEETAQPVAQEAAAATQVEQTQKTAQSDAATEKSAAVADAEEVNSNGRENGRVSDINSTLDAGSDGERAPRLLEEVQNGNVSGDAQGRNASSDASERGGQAQQSGSGPDNGKRTGRGPGEGDSQSADLRRDGGLSPEDKATADESLHEVVTQQIEQRSTEKPKGSNYVIGDSLNLPSGDKARYKANIDAIRLVKQLEAEGRTATAAEQETLSKYVGWGGLANAFGEERYNRELRKSESVAKTGWEKEFAELREALTDDEYKAARASTNNAHYTDISVIRGMYSGLKRLGFTGGRMLEPSSGVGNFVGAMPADMSSTVKSWTMVELDNITGLIAKHLYPNADVRIQGFEKANIPDNYMDVAIGNVPFGNYAITDRAYPTRVKSAIHNYFFAKSIDKVRPGGVVMFITSSFTMSSKDNAVRRYISERADLLGAIRLPGGAFKENAGTDVVTDILILKKRAAGTEYAGQAFVNTAYTTIDDYSELQNEYFMAHPEMVLGTPTHTRGMYGSNTLTYAPLEGKGNLAEQIDAAFSNIKGKMDYSAVQSPDKTNFAVERSLKKPKQGSLTVRSDGKAYRDEDGTPVEISSDKAKVEKITGIISIRDSYRALATALQQKQNESSVKAARKALNTAYDAFVAKYGFLNKPQNRSTILLDPDSYSILSLETYNAETKTGVKADIFKKDTISPNRTITSVEDVKTGVIVSVNETGGIDVPLIAKLTGKTQEAVTRELLDGRLAYKNSDGVLEAPETYLAGNVRAKLREAEARAPLDKDYESNVAALKAVIPEDIPYQDIYVVPGAPWVPANVYADFIAHMLGGVNNPNSYSGPDVVVKRSNETGNFTIEIRNSRLKSGYRNIQTWGTKERHFTTLIDSLMASRSVTVRYKTADGSYVVDKVATAAANEKLELITSEFQKWLWSDEARTKELATLYNETFNAIVNPKYNGENLTVNGANPAKPLRAHQRDAVQRIISSGGNTLLAHKVGAGKTYEMAAAAMKLRQLGLVKKPVFVVPKSLVAQWGTEFKDFFPVAKLLVADEKSFTANNRKVFVNQIANGDYDAIILSYEQFEKVPMSADFQREFYQEQIDEVISAIAEEKEESGGRSLSIKDMEKKRKQLQAKIDKLTDKVKDEDNTEFDRLGIDSLFVDEAHNFKNLEYVSRMTNIAGLSNSSGAKRSFDLYTKVRYLQKMNGGRGIVFATATPVMNSMSELYIMQKYLQSDRLKQLGLSTFDAWAKQFGEVVNTTEIKPSGQGFRVKQVFSRFRNLSELQLLFRSFSDVLTDIPGLKVPTMKGGKVNVVVCEPSQFQKDFMLQLEERADNIKNVDPSVDNMLKITSDGRKVAYTQRMIDPSLPYEEGCKIYRCCDNVAAAWKASATFTGADGKAYKNGTQLVFCDMATPKGKKGGDADSEDDNDGMDMENARLYDDIKARLIKKGIPAKQIAFIHEADTDAKKKKLFADMNDGVIRVLIGSTGKMGVGMNAQRRIVAIHHLDAPWRPGDVEQRNGRAYRQGNLNAEVEDFTYVTEGSFDARLWDILDRKSKFINQIMEGNDVGRSAEDTGNVTLSAAEVKALASGNPLIMEQVQLSNDIQKLENLSRAHTSDVLSAKKKLAEDETKIATLKRSIDNGKADVKARTTDYIEESFSMTVGNKKYSTKKDAGAALVRVILAKATEDKYTTVGSFAGFELRAIKIGLDYKGLIFGKQGYDFNVHIGNPTYMVGQISASIEGLPGKVEKWQGYLDEAIADKDAQETIISSSFAKKDELEQKRVRFNEIMAILNPTDEQDLDSLDEGEDGEEQYQSRSYLRAKEEAQAFSYEVNNWLNEGRPDTETLMLGSTGDVLQGLGAIESDIYMLGEKINITLNKHPEITLNEIKRIPEVLNDPVLILKSKNAYRGGKDNTRLVMFGSIKAENGTPMLVILDLRPIENGFLVNDMQKVTSAYIKDRDPVTFIETSAVLHADIKRAIPLLHTIGFQMPIVLKQSGSIGSISFQDDSVNIKGLPFSAVVGAPQQTQSGDKKPVEQKYKSAGTSQNQLPGLFKNSNAVFAGTNIDIGGGEYDQATEYLAERGTRNMIFDPFNRSEKENRAVLDFLRGGERADTATCANVLNVIMEQDARKNVILEVAKSIKPDGTAYFTTYEKSGTGVGGVTQGERSWQESRKTPTYEAEIRNYFDDVIHVGKLIIAKQPKVNLPTASWELYPGHAEQYQRRQRGYTDTEVLEIAAEQVSSTDMNDAEKDALRIFQERLGKLRDLQDERQSLGQLYRQQQFGIDSEGNKVKVDRDAADSTRRKMDVADSRIETAKNGLVKVENAPALRRILKEARQVVEQAEEERGQELLKAYRARRDESVGKKKYQARVQREVESLRQMLMHPSNKEVIKHVPSVIQKSVADFITTIDFTSARKLRGGDDTQADARFLERMTAMRNAITSNTEFAGAYSGYADLPDGFMAGFQAQIDHVQALIAEHSGEYVVNRMSAADLRELSHTLRDLRRYIQDMNKFHNNSMFAHAYEAGDDTMQYLTKLGSATGKKGKAYNFMAWQYMRPAYAFSRFGKGGESIFNEFREGQAQQAFLAKDVINFSKKAYKPEEVKAWSKDIKTFTIGGETVSMPATAAMSFYCLYKRAQALTHIHGEGIRVANFKDGKYTYRDEGHALTPEDAQAIISSLSPRQVEVATEIQKYMSTECAKWGNYVTMKRFATEVYGEANYFPINSDGRHLQAEGEESPSNASLYALLNAPFSKELKENANNRLVLYNIFDVFANHAASMAQYRSFALPLLDALKWFNYKTASGSIRDAMATAYGAPVEQKPGSGAKSYAEQFVLGILKAYNGTTARGDIYDNMGIRALHRFNRAQVAYNVRVVVQQPLAITRAAMILKPDKLIAGLGKSATQMKALADEMDAHSGIAAWKSLGFYDTNISKGLTSMIKRDFTVGERVTDVGMWGAEKADRYTWAAMWSACKDTVDRRSFKTEDEYFAAVTELFEQVIYKTQVVDSVLTKSEFLRAQSFFSRMAGAFMSEPSATVSMLTDAYLKFSEDIQRGMSQSEAWQRNSRNIGKTFIVYAVGQALLAAAQAVVDAWRDDDDYETYVQKYLEALKGNLVDETLPFGKIPFLSEFYDMSKDVLSKFGVDTYGFVGSNGWMQYAQYLTKAIEIFVDKAKGDNTKYTIWGGIYNLLRGTAGMTGIPFSTASREVIDAWNNTVGAIVPDKKIKTYDNSTGAQAYETVLKVYQQGHDTQVAEILAQLAAHELEDGKSSQWEAENSVMSTLQSNVKTWFTDGTIDERTARGLLEYTDADIEQTILECKGKIETGYTKTEAESAFIHAEMEETSLKDYFVKYSGMSAEDADVRITKLKCEKDTGVVYDHMKEMLMDDTITTTKIVSLMQKYGGRTKEAAETTVKKWQCEKDTGVVYDDISIALANKQITAAKAVTMLVAYGGKEREIAEKTVSKWEFIGTDSTLSGISAEAVESYNSGCAPAGISKKQFYTAWDEVNDIFGDDLDGDGKNDAYTAMTKKYAYINTLPLTNAQKTALALAIVSSASEKNISQRAPW